MNLQWMRPRADTRLPEDRQKASTMRWLRIHWQNREMKDRKAYGSESGVISLLDLPLDWKM